MRLGDFKAVSLAKLMKLSKVLREKYPEKKEKVEYVVSLIASKLQHLRRYSLADYLFTLYNATFEFPELEELVPDEKTVLDLLSEEEE
ncbi:MAG: hypothetical protein QW794_01690 [Thermosphaera sp.]